MRIRPLILSLFLSVGLVACGDEATEERVEGGTEFAEREQLHSESGAEAPARAEAGPEARLAAFFTALEDNQPRLAAALVAMTPLDVGEEELLESLRQWSGRIAAAQQKFDVLESKQQDDFAIARARFMTVSGGEADEAIRPVVLFREEGEWKVVWDLIGLEREQLERMDAATAERLAPLYDWYEERELYEAPPADGEADSPGG